MGGSGETVASQQREKRAQKPCGVHEPALLEGAVCGPGCQGPCHLALGKSTWLTGLVSGVSGGKDFAKDWFVFFLWVLGAIESF